MNNRSQKYFSSKILLFGEYTVTIGSNALAIPFKRFSGYWKFDKSKNNQVFFNFIRYLRNINWSNHNSEFLHKKILDDLKKGLYFDSNIKTGFGVGSSGALCAGIFNTYFTTKDHSIENISAILAKIESYFHGTSSGIDPLVSYLDKAVAISTNGFEIFDKSIIDMKNHQFYLLDSNISRRTKKYVDIFKEKILNEDYKKQILYPLTLFNDKIVKSFIDKSESELFEFFNEISRLQFNGFREMIIPKLFKMWEDSLSSKDIAIKLCGAGGGGYYLIIANKNIDITKFTKDFTVLPI